MKDEQTFKGAAGNQKTIDEMREAIEAAGLSASLDTNELDAEGLTDNAPEAAITLPEAVTALQEKEAENQNLRDAFLRARAETENARRQAKDEVEKARKFAIERFASDLLNVKDALETALKTENATPEQLREGVELTLKQLTSAFEKARVVEVDPQGQLFDPHVHQAVQTLPSDAAPNTVVAVFQKGYLVADRVLRPAMVAVAKAKENAAS